MLKSENGFTLIEMILVIAILAIIASIAIPSVMFGIRDARISTDKANARNIADAIQWVVASDNSIHRVDINPAIEFQADVPDATADDIEGLIEAAEVYLQSAPQVKHGNDSGTNFYVEIGAASGITVYADNEAGAAVTLIELYPTPAGEWDN